MGLGRTTTYRAAGITALMGIALIGAACGSSSSSSTASSAASKSGSANASNTPTTAVAVGTAKGSLGTYLTGSSGRALYIWVADTNGKSSCSGACAAAWPPVVTKSTPTASGGAIAADLGTTTRPDGTQQVTYKGRPLYYYAGDSGPGMTNGNGSDQFGAKWWLITPSGRQVGASSSSSVA